MTAPAACPSFIRGRNMRVTKLDECNNPVLGPANQVTTAGVISVALTPETDAGTTISQVNANGQTCIRDVPAPVFLDYTVEISLCGVDPYLVNFLSGSAIVFNDESTARAVGFKTNSKLDLSQVRFAIEMWSAVAGADCSGSNKPYGYFLLPAVQGGTIGNITWQNDAINFTISGAVTKDDNQWGVGPYNVLVDNSGADSPLLEALDPNDHLLVQEVFKAPPAASCGAGPLGTLATGATAGTPGNFTPTNSYAPANLAGMTGETATPSTAWTTGQYVTLYDGSKAHWSGTAWVAGPA